MTASEKMAVELPAAAPPLPRNGRPSRARSMRERLGLYFLMAVLIPLGFGTLVSEHLIERHINALAIDSARGRLDVAEGRLADQGRLLLSELTRLAARSDLPGAIGDGDGDAAGAILRAHGVSSRDDLLWLVTADGRLMARAARGPVGAELDGLPIVRRALGGERLVSYEEIDPALLRRDDPALAARLGIAARSAPGASLPSTVLLQAAAVPIGDGQRVVAALVSGRVLTGRDSFADLLEPGQSNVAIAHRGVWVASSPSDPGARERGAPIGGRLSPGQMRSVAHGGRWLGAGGHAEGGELFSALAPLANAQGEPIGALAVRISTARFASLQGDARGAFIVAMGAGAMIALLLALLAARQITGPLRRLAPAAAAMEKGRFDVPIPVEGNDEVAQLAVALNRTAGALSESMSTLESRVRERTSELVQARDREAALNRDLTVQNDRLSVQGELLRAQGDILEQQRRELEEKSRRGEEADRLKNAFIANMSHEIRTPLNSVLALSQLLHDGMAGPLSADQRKYLEVIERNGQNLLRLINDILDLSRIEAGHLEMDLRSVDLAPHIRAAVNALTPLAEAKGLDVQVRLPEPLPPVRCDVDRVRQVLTNLVGNAIKFTEVGQVQVSAEVRDGLVAIHVTDTGVGIPAGLTRKIFQEFVQVDQTLARRQGGTGLGLAIASRLAHLMGGDIAVESVPGSGSRFTLTLPRGGAAVEDAPVDAAAEVGAPLGGRVLLVDDEEVDRNAARTLLEGAGLQVLAVGSGAEAMAALRGQELDAVVMDLFMPGLNGFDVIGEVRQDPRLSRLPFVVLTAHDLTSADRDALPAPVVGFVHKGEAMRAGLLSMLRKALKSHRGPADAAPIPPRSASVLLVEDNEDNLFTLRQMLNRLPVDLASASSGRDAIDYCRRRRPDLIIMDMQMPGMSGLQATGAIRALPGGATIPIIALTAQAMKGDRERILAAGCDEYLAKPIQPRELLGVVERLLGAHEGQVPGARLRPVVLSGDEKGTHGTHTPRR